MKKSFKNFLQNAPRVGGRISLRDIELTDYILDIAFDKFLFHFYAYDMREEQKDYLIKNNRSFTQNNSATRSPLELFLLYNSSKKMYLNEQQIHFLIDSHDNTRHLVDNYTLLGHAFEQHKTEALNLTTEHWQKLIDRADFQLKESFYHHIPIVTALRFADKEKLNITDTQWLMLIDKSISDNQFLPPQALCYALEYKFYGNTPQSWTMKFWRSLINNTITKDFCRSEINVLQIIKKFRSPQEFIFIWNLLEDKKSMLQILEAGQNSPNYTSVKRFLELPEVVTFKEWNSIDSVIHRKTKSNVNKI